MDPGYKIPYLQISTEKEYTIEESEVAFSCLAIQKLD